MDEEKKTIEMLLRHLGRELQVDIIANSKSFIGNKDKGRRNSALLKDRKNRERRAWLERVIQEGGWQKVRWGRGKDELL